MYVLSYRVGSLAAVAAPGWTVPAAGATPCAGSPRRRRAEDRPRARPAPGDRAGLAGPPQDPRTAPRGTQWRWNARDAGSPWPTARAASRAARSPDITSCAIGKASPPSCDTARIGGLPRRCAGQATAPVATTRRDAVPVKPRCQAPLSHHRPLSDGRGGPRCRAGAVTGGWPAPVSSRISPAAAAPPSGMYARPIPTPAAPASSSRPIARYRAAGSSLPNQSAPAAITELQVLDGKINLLAPRLTKAVTVAGSRLLDGYGRADHGRLTEWQTMRHALTLPSFLLQAG